MKVIKLKTFSIFILLFLCLSLHRALAEEVLTWSDCLAEAKKNHPDLISAEEKVNQQEAGKIIAGSVLYPQIDANLDWSQTKTTTKKRLTPGQSLLL